jgi:hypothetical protein
MNHGPEPSAKSQSGQETFFPDRLSELTLGKVKKNKADSKQLDLKQGA